MMIFIRQCLCRKISERSRCTAGAAGNLSRLWKEDSRRDQVLSVLRRAFGGSPLRKNLSVLRCGNKRERKILYKMRQEAVKGKKKRGWRQPLFLLLKENEGSADESNVFKYLDKFLKKLNQI